jgi:hypothetical protein
MANDRAIIAESVLDVLESARVQRQSGRLFVGQFLGGRFQEGEIQLQQGLPVYARLGALTGSDALSRLVSWRNVQLTLIPEETRNASTQPGPAIDTGGRITSFPKRQSDEYNQIRAPGSPRANPTGNQGRPPDIERLAPRKRNVDRDVLSLPLTRPQRYIYFMVDGRRTIADLSRCTGKTIQEVDLILGELQAQGLVVI